MCDDSRFFLPSHSGLGDAITLQHVFADAGGAKLLRSGGHTKKTTSRSSRHRARETELEKSRSPPTAFAGTFMDHLSGYAHRPFPFVLRYLRRRLPSHVVILSAVVAAVACSVGTQYGVKSLVDALSAGPSAASGV